MPAQNNTPYFRLLGEDRGFVAGLDRFHEQFDPARHVERNSFRLGAARWNGTKKRNKFNGSLGG
jgi:hypothetical protein